MRYGQRDQLSWLSFDEAIRYTDCRQLKGFFDQVVIPQLGDTLVIDLSDTPSIDSTGLGLLASLGRHCLTRFSRRAVILCPEGQLSQCLRAMQFDKLFTLTDSLDVPPDLSLSPVAPVATTPDGYAAVMLEAHRELSDVDEKNRHRFSDVVAELERAATRHR